MSYPATKMYIMRKPLKMSPTILYFAMQIQKRPNHEAGESSVAEIQVAPSPLPMSRSFKKIFEIINNKEINNI
jgi:hypothetical protein